MNKESIGLRRNRHRQYWGWIKYTLQLTLSTTDGATGQEWVALVKGVALIVLGTLRGSARRWRRECGSDSWGFAMLLLKYSQRSM